MVMIEVMARRMTGYVDVKQPRYRRRPGNTTLFTAWAIDRFGPRRQFVREMGKFIRAVRSSRPATSGGKVLLPGEIESRTASMRRKKGIPVADVLWNELSALAEKKSAKS